MQISFVRQLPDHSNKKPGVLSFASRWQCEYLGYSLVADVSILTLAVLVGAWVVLRHIWPPEFSSY